MSKRRTAVTALYVIGSTSVIAAGFLELGVSGGLLATAVACFFGAVVVGGLE